MLGLILYRLGFTNIFGIPCYIVELYDVLILKSPQLRISVFKCIDKFLLMIVDMSKCTWDKKDVTINLNWYTKWHNASKTYKCFIGSRSYMKHI